MKLNGLANTEIYKPDILDGTDEAISVQKHSAEQTHAKEEHKPWKTDAVDSAAHIETYNNYSSAGTHVDKVTAQQSTSTDSLSKVPVASETVDGVEIDPETPNMPQTEADRLAQAFKESEAFVRMMEKHQHAIMVKVRELPEWRALGSQLIEDLSPKHYEILQKMLWTAIARTHEPQWHNEDARNFGVPVNKWQSKLNRELPLKNNHQDYNLVDMWNGVGLKNSELMEFTMYNTVTMFFMLKASAGYLDDNIRTFLPQVRFGEDSGPDATFENRMASIAEYVNQQFKEAQRTLTATDRFSISLNSNFTFNVRGGSRDSNEFLQDVLNNAGGWLLTRVLDSIFNHRGENGEVPSWLESTGTVDFWRILAEDFGMGFIEASDEYLEWIDRLWTARARKQTDEWLFEEFGFGLDDLTFSNGRLSGRTQEITDVINSDDRFEQYLLSRRTLQSASIVDALRTPPDLDLSFINIIFEDGRFSIIY